MIPSGCCWNNNFNYCHRQQHHHRWTATRTTTTFASFSNSESSNNNNIDNDSNDNTNYDSIVDATHDYTDIERIEMKELIVQLSLEPTDHDRRTRVKEIFHNVLGEQRPNDGTSKRYTDLFDMVLSEVGEEVQLRAKKRFFEEEAIRQQQQVQDQQQQEGEEEVSSSESSLESNDSTSTTDATIQTNDSVDVGVSEKDTDEQEQEQQRQWKYPEELQLWALIDIMVQSKTIVKKAEGTLGSKGTFQ
jgi:hypothetical protein